MLLHVKIILLFILSIPVFSQTVQKLEITGNTVFDDSRIAEWSGLRTGMPFNLSEMDSAAKRLSNMLNNRGYIDHTIEIKSTALPDTQKINLLVKVTEGKPYLVNRIKIKGADSLPARSVSSFKFLEGQIFSRAALEEQITESLIYLENNGYPFTRILITSVSFNKENNKADVLLQFETGIRNTIDNIEVTGNTKTKDEVIVRELRINKGELYSQQMVEELPRRLNRLRFFEPVNTPAFYMNSKNEGILQITIKEKETNYFDGIVGYIPPADEDAKGYLTGLVNVSMRNLFGTGRAAAIKWQQYDRLSQEMELRYLEPWIFSFPLNISGGFFQRKQDSTYVQRRIDGSLEYLATEDISAAVFIQSESVIPSEALGNVFRVFNSSSVTTGINLKLDTRDDPFAPTEGVLFQNLYSFSKKKISGPLQFITPDLETNINLQRFSFDFSYFYSLFSRQVIAASVHGRELRGSFFEESDLFRLGGTNSLRGYRENQFFASRILWTNLEYRLLLTRRTFAFVFYDTGYFIRREELRRNIPKLEDFKMGYGFGLNLETALGVLIVSYALGDGDTFSTGKIHFGIVNEF
jgi:outer membrane protein insertion porin family